MTNDFNLDRDIYEYLRLQKLQEDTPHMLTEEAEMNLRMIIEKYIAIVSKILNDETFVLMTAEQKRNRAINFVNKRMNKNVENATNEFEKQLWEKARTQIIEAINEMKIKDIQTGV